MNFENHGRFGVASLILGVSLTISGCGGGGQTSDAPQSVSAPPASAGGAKSGLPIPTGGSKIVGSVKFEGDLPRLKEIDMADEPVCSNHWSDQDMSPVSEALVLGPDNVVANVFLTITSGPSGGPYAPSSVPVEVDQKGCKYVPHVFAVMKGQNIVFKNSDGVLHNVHALPKQNREFNLAMPGSMKVAKPRSFKKAEGMFKIKCDKHPWMSSYAAVLDHPFFDVTGEDGNYEIKGLPAGTYEIEAWHEKMGTRSASVTVAANETQTVDFAFSK